MTAPGRLLGGRYEVGELLGYGGMAEVHLGRDHRLGREVAIKMLRTDLARDHTFQLRFRREAQNAATLNHPGIAAIYDTGEEQSPTGEALPYIVMEYVSGQTLKDVLATERRLQPRRALEITADICAALEFSHRHGIIHRDIKPGNVMITPNGQVKVMDFGIARDLASGATTMTQTSAVIGTAQYLSPEQARGEAVDARSDVYATGCVLFELLCGHPPFVGDSPVAVAYQHVRETPRAPSDLNPEIGRDIDAIVLKALSKNPANRYQSAAEMRADLLRAANGRPVLATPVMGDEQTALLGQPGGPGGPEPARVADPGRRRTSTWVLVALGVLGVLAVVALVVGLVLSNSDPGVRQATVPSLLGLSPEEAEAQVLAAELVPALGDEFRGECTVGQVAEQSPAAQATIDLGGTVTYRVCAGPEQVTVPDLEDLTRELAERELEQLDLVPQFDEEDSELPEGQVIGSDPEAGDVVDKGSTVRVRISAGNLRTVPDVTGLSRVIAADRLEQNGFVVAQEESEVPPPSPEDVGMVESQDPAGGERREVDSRVTIFYYGEGPELVADVQVTGPTEVTVTWDNGIYGGVTIDWGDGQPAETFNNAEGDQTHNYTVPPSEYTITVTATEHTGRTVTLPVVLP